MHNKEFHTVRGYQLIKQKQGQLTPAMEDYLEMIYRNSMDKGYIRMGKLAQLLNVSVPSASRMVKRLSSLGLLEFEKYGLIFLNDNGREIGEYLLERHRILEDFLRLLDCKDNLLQQTEMIEHDISPELLVNIQILNSFFTRHDDIKTMYLIYRSGCDKELII